MIAGGYAAAAPLQRVQANRSPAREIIATGVTQGETLPEPLGEMYLLPFLLLDKTPRMPLRSGPKAG